MKGNVGYLAHNVASSERGETGIHHSEVVSDDPSNVYFYAALLHKDFKERAFLSCLNLSDNLGVRSAELRKLI